MTSTLGNTMTDLLQAGTLVLVIVSVAILSAAVGRLSRSIHLLAAARFTEQLTNQTLAEMRKEGIE